MPNYFRLPSGSATMAIGYITTGVLMVVWTIVWLIYLLSNDSESRGPYYICSGLMVSGLALMTIGILMGRIGREAKGADAVAPVAGPQDVVATAPQQAIPQQVAPQQAVPQQVAPVVQQMPAPTQPQQVVGR